MAPRPSRVSTAENAPEKPRPDFPLFAHQTGRWAKKIGGRLYYFGPWEDAIAAEKKYLQQRADLEAGRRPKGPAETGQGTIRDLINRFLGAKEKLLKTGELAGRSFHDYDEACCMIGAYFGLARQLGDIRPGEFEKLRLKISLDAGFRASARAAASSGRRGAKSSRRGHGTPAGRNKKQLGPVALGNIINRIRVVFKFAFEEELLERPIRYGQSFKRPSKKSIRQERAKKGAKLFTPEEIQRLTAAAGPQLRAMILLGINGGLGNTDCGRLPLSAVNLKTGWIEFPRPKTGIARRFPLWPETIEALRVAIADRPEPRDPADAGLVFITKYGGTWGRDDSRAVSNEMAKLLRALEINGRHGLNFYSLRHTHRTIADAAKDQPAAFLIMGHEMGDMSDVYREGIDDSRLREVVNHVRGWLFDK
jgi:integrase